MTKVTREFLEERNACVDGYKYWIENCENLNTIDQLLKLNEEHFDYANWLIVRILSHKQKVQYAVFSAELALPIFEQEYPNDDRPRNTIEVVKKCIKDPSKKNKTSDTNTASAAAAAGVAYADASVVHDRAAYAAAYAAYAAYAASYAASDDASDDDAYTASADYATDAAAYVDDSVAHDTKKEFQNKIINYGIKLLKENV